MAREEWGTKRTCPTTGKRFYDLNRTPIVSPYTGEIVDIARGPGNKTKTRDAEKAPVAATVEAVDEDEEVILDDSDDDEEDVAVGDDLLEEDDDDSSVSLDELADVSEDDDEN